jgi:DNA helicase II / ATP-dependent DNA helicase PcrA
LNVSDETWDDLPVAEPRVPGRAEITAGLTPAQTTAAAHDGAILVLAGAGIGKTRTLIVGVALRIAEQGVRPNRILCVTFTNKAAAETKERIVTMPAGYELPSWVGTFHALAPGSFGPSGRWASCGRAPTSSTRTTASGW